MYIVVGVEVSEYRLLRAGVCEVLTPVSQTTEKGEGRREKDERSTRVKGMRMAYDRCDRKRGMEGSKCPAQCQKLVLCLTLGA